MSTQPFRISTMQCSGTALADCTDPSQRCFIPSKSKDGGGAQDARKTRLRFLRDRILGSDPNVSTRTAMPLIVSALYCSMILLVHVWGIPSGEVSEAGGRLLTLYCSVGIVAFYPFIRSGVTQKLSEPSLALPQIMYGSVGAVILYHMFPSTRILALQFMCLGQIFGLIRLSAPAAMTGGLGVVAILLVSTVAMSPNGLSDPAQRIDLTVVGFEAVILLTLATLTSRYSRLRDELAQQQHQLTDAVERLRHVVTHDALTGLYNRQRMQEQLDRETNRCTHSKEVFTIALVDMDHFKRVNDAHGHQVGDAVLQSFAKAARQVLRGTDVIARWGGEEFLAIFPGPDPSVASQNGLLRLAKALTQQQVSEHCPDLRVTFSAGMTTYRQGESLHITLERADKALYAAKSRGRNQGIVA